MIIVLTTKKWLMNTQRLLFVLLFSVFSVLVAEAQQVSDSDAEELIYLNNIDAAADAFDAKVRAEPNNPDYRLKLGYCLLSLPNRKEEAMVHLQKAEKLYRKSGEDRAAFDAKYQMARAYRKTLHFGDAIVLFNELMIESKRKDYEAVDILLREISLCENAQELMNVDQPYRVKNMGDNINSAYSEHSPFLTFDEGLFVFTSRRQSKFNTEMPDGEYDENIYKAEKSQDEFWTKPELLPDKINTPGNDANCGLSADGSKVYVYRAGDIYVSEHSGNNWSEIAKLGKYVNTAYRELHLFVSNDAQTIYFTSDMPDGYGGTDIYRIKKQGDKWSKPQNLGPDINTPYDDDSPFLHENGTLYFSSKGHNSMGGFDIFSAKTVGDKFENVQNMGYPINSVEDDIHFFLSTDEQRVYLCSKRAGGFGHSDIYYINFADTMNAYVNVKGKLNISEGGAGKNIRLKVYRESTKKHYETINTDTSGVFGILSERGERYFVTAEKEGYFPEVFSYPAPIDNVAEYTLSDKTISPVQPVYVNKKYILAFNKGQTTLSNISELLLDVITEFMGRHPNLEIDIAGNGSQEQIERKRIQAVNDYMITKGLSESKINVGTESYEGENQFLLVTIIDASMREYLETGELGETPIDTAGQKVNDNTYIPSGSGGSDVFTIRLGKFKEKQKISQDFYEKFQGQIKQVTDDQGLYIYTYGAFTQRNLAEDNLLIIQKMGYPDAEIIQLKQ